jgi:protein involved in polysaccharide export with SLBB domain
MKAVVVWFAIGIGGCGSSGGNLPPPVAARGNPGLGAGDVIEVRVVGEDELAGTHRVSDDGTIYFPYIGRVEIAGRDEAATAELLATRLRDDGFLRAPQVTVFIRDATSQQVTVMGAVDNPGNFALAPGLTIVRAISLAGGFTALAARNSVVVTRRIDGELRRFNIPVGDMMTEGRDDVPLQAGDIIYVDERVF